MSSSSIGGTLGFELRCCRFESCGDIGGIGRKVMRQVVSLEQVGSLPTCHTKISRAIAKHNSVNSEHEGWPFR